MAKKRAMLTAADAPLGIVLAGTALLFGVAIARHAAASSRAFMWGAWTAEDFRALARLAARLRMKASDLLGVLFSESELKPWAVNPQGSSTPIAVGLNQLTSVTDPATGLTEAQRFALARASVADQLPFVERYFASLPYVQKGGAFPDPGTIYAANFAPGRIGDGSDGTVLYTAARDGDSYMLNKGFDVANKGAITIGDLRAHVAAVMQRKDFLDARAALRAAAGL